MALSYTTTALTILAMHFDKLYNKFCYLEDKSQVLDNLFRHILHVPTLSQGVDWLWNRQLHKGAY